MDNDTHRYLHYTIGTIYYTGLDFTNFNIGDGSDDSHSKFLTTTGIIFDEDITHEVVGKTQYSVYKKLYLTGVTTSSYVNNWDFTHDTFPVLYNENGLLYNYNTGNTWSLKNVTDNYYVLLHILASNDTLTGITGEFDRLHFIVGYNEYADISSATSNMGTELRNIKIRALTPEYAPIATIIYQSSSIFTNTVKGRIVPNSNGDNFKDWRGHSFGSIGMKFIV